MLNYSQRPEAVVTLQGAAEDPWSFPANFWAPVHSAAELRQFLAVVFSYRPGVQP